MGRLAHIYHTGENTAAGLLETSVISSTSGYSQISERRLEIILFIGLHALVIEDLSFMSFRNKTRGVL